MAMVTCGDCGHIFSNLRHHGLCPKCHPKVTPPANPYALPIKKQLIYGSLFGLFCGTVLCGCQQLFKEDPVSKATEVCRLTAHLHTSEQGSSMYIFAEADSPSRAILHFRHPKSGRRWTTNYFCN